MSTLHQNETELATSDNHRICVDICPVDRDIAPSRSCICELCFCLLCNLLSVYLFDFFALMYVIDLFAETMVHTLPLLD